MAIQAKNLSFKRHLIVSILGTVISRLIGFIVLPLITRIFDPTSIGIWHLLLALSSFFFPLATMRYELAVVLPRSDRSAANLLWGVVVLSCLVTMLVVVILQIFTIPIANIFGLAENSELLWVAPISLAFLATQTTFNSWIIRTRHFGLKAILEIVAGIVTPAVAILVALYSQASAAVYVLGALAGQATYAMGTVLIAKYSGFFKVTKHISWRLILREFYKYRVYPLYTMPYSLSNDLVDRLFTIMLGMLFSLATLGAYRIALQITLTPITLITTGLRQVLFSYAADSSDKKRINEVIQFLLLSIVTLVIPFVAFGFHYLPNIVNMFLGDDWSQAGQFSRWLLLYATSTMFTTWLDRMYDVHGRQRLSVILQVISDIILLCVIAVCYALNLPPLNTIAAYSIALAIIDMVWLIITLKMVGISDKFLVKLLLRGTQVLAFSIVILGFIEFIASPLWGTVVGSGILIIYAIVFSTKFMKVPYHEYGN